MLAFCMMIACSHSSSFSDIEEQALSAAQQFVQSEYAPDADFIQDGTVIEPTSVADRYKILQRFDSDSHYGHKFVYRIWVQKFSTGWEFGNLAIDRVGGGNVLTTDGRMKDMERQNMTRQESSSAGGVDFTIIKRNAPNYVRVYTEKRLNRDDVLAVYNQLKTDYEIVQFSISPNPEDDDYMAIQYGSVYEYDKDKITKLVDY